jgi:phytoene dehydrogenase-like protein
LDNALGNKYDVVVIGGGHNGLTAAALLAQKGRKVIVLEMRSTLGGLAASEEFHPGYRTAGVIHDSSGVRARAVEALRLKGYGLELEDRQPSIFTPERRGRGLLLHHDPDKAAGEISNFSSIDVERYAAFRKFIERVRGFVNGVFDEAPADLTKLAAGDTWRLIRRSMRLRRLGKKDAAEVIRIVTMSVADWLDEWFESDLLKASLAGPALYGTFMGPRSPSSAFNLLVWECRKRPSVKGGPGFLVTALEGAARASGAELRTDAKVTGIRVDGGKVTGVSLDGGETIDSTIVAASCDPKQTFLHLLGGRRITKTLARRMSHVRSQGTSAMVNVALNARVEMAGRPGELVEFVRTGENLDELEKAFDAVKYNKISEKPVLDIYIPTFSNAGFAPEGHTVFSVLTHFIPKELDGGWNYREREKLGERVIDTLSEYAPSLRNVVEAVNVLTPADIEERYGITGGHVYHGEHALDQLLIRPTPECAQYATPIKGLYLCGSGSHPGGGITCAPGFMSAQAILGGK